MASMEAIVMVRVPRWRKIKQMNPLPFESKQMDCKHARDVVYLNEYDDYGNSGGIRLEDVSKFANAKTEPIVICT
jgi:hypothetical protein